MIESFSGIAFFWIILFVSMYNFRSVNILCIMLVMKVILKNVFRKLLRLV